MPLQMAGRLITVAARLRCVAFGGAVCLGNATDGWTPYNGQLKVKKEKRK